MLVSSKMLLAVVLFAVPLVVQAEVKLGYVDLNRALLEIDEGRDAKRRLQSTLDNKQKEIDKEQEALLKEKEVLDKQASMMSEETRRQRETDLQKRFFQLTQKWDKGRQEMAGKERDELAVIYRRMDPIIADIAQREGITMVFDKTVSGLVYAPAHLDLTNELVRLYNDRYKNQKKGGASGAPKSDAAKVEAKTEGPKTAAQGAK